MPNITLNISKTAFSPTLFPLLLDYSHRWEVYKGSAGSGKSYFITQKLITRCCREKIKVLVCRRYGSTIRNTCFSLFKEILTKWQLLPYVKIRETDFNIKFPNGSEIIFMGLDEETKLLSLNDIGTIFIEEVFEVNKDIVEQLNLRMRSTVPNQQILMAFNPISKAHWLYNFCIENPLKSFFFSETTYKDNPFLSKEYVNSLEELIVRNPSKAKVYCFGEWGVPNEGLVFHNWQETALDLQNLLTLGLERRAGADLGFIDPTTIVDTLYDKHNKTIYVLNEYYKSGQQLDAVSQAIRSMELEKTKIYMDSAEPRSIDYFKKQGFYVAPCIKGRDSVKAGISFLQNHTIIVSPQCQNLITELSNFSYQKNKDGQYQDDSYTHEYSHGIDGLRYAYSDIYTKSGLKTLDKAVLGL